MYRIIGSDGKEYGPIGADLLTQWIRDRRATPQTQVRAEGSTEWKRLSEFPEFHDALASQPPPAGPPIAAVPGAGGGQVPVYRDRAQGMAIASMVLGLLGFCFGFLTGIPAIILGHMAHGRARRSPETYGGSGFAVAGLVLGYVNLILGTAVMAGMFLPAFAKAKERAQSINCIANMKQIGLGARMWAEDHQLAFPEDFRSMSAELIDPKVLVCPASGEVVATSWESLGPDNISYEFVTPGVATSDNNASEVAFRCKYHGHAGLIDGSVRQNPVRH